MHRHPTICPPLGKTACRPKPKLAGPSHLPLTRGSPPPPKRPQRLAHGAFVLGSEPIPDRRGPDRQSHGADPGPHPRPDRHRARPGGDRQPVTCGDELG
jgi:hypothetical protein